MLSLDEDDLVMLGFGNLHEATSTDLFIHQLQRQTERALYDKERAKTAKRKAQFRAYRKKYSASPVKKTIDKRYRESPKGKATRARAWKKYYEKNKAKIIARIDAWRKARRAKKEE